jgi:hypothetical protein
LLQRLAVLSFIFLFGGNLLGQVSDTTQVSNIEFITDQLENLAERTDIELDFSDLLEDYLYYSKNPINLNGPHIQELRSLYLLNDIQLNNLKSTLHEFGPLLSIYELQNIPGFDDETIKNMLPFVIVGDVSTKTKTSLKNAFRFGRHQLLLRYDQVFEKRAGYSIPIDSAIYFPGSAYLGSPQKYYARYAFNFKNKLRFGFTLDKDPGELVNKNKLPDTLKNLIGNKVTPVFDFISAFAYAETDGFVKQIALGDYHLEFGQGLTLWSGLAFGKSSEAIQIRKYGRGIRPNTSANENRFFRGAAITLGYGNFSFTSFYSSNKVDSNIEPDVVDQDEGVTSIIETGLHRTINELLDKRSLQITAYGAHASYQANLIQLGLTAYETRTGTPITPSSEVYKNFNFTGSKLTNYGVDFGINLNKVNFFGEFSMSSNRARAGLAGINTFLSDRLLFTLFYHNYAKDYQNLYNNPFYESSAISNEQGIYFGIKALITRNLNLSCYLDHFQFPWIKYRVDGPSIGRDYLLQLTYTPLKKIMAYARIRMKAKQENYSLPYEYTKLIKEVSRNEFWFFISYEIWPEIVLKNRLDVVYFKKANESAEKGYLVYQDVLFRPEQFPIEITFRYALFGTDGYDSRIYTYENDVLYAFSVPSYFGDGQRVYIMAKWNMSSRVNFWLRLSRTTYFHQNTISSGADEINGNHKTEIKAEVKIKL